MQRREFLQAALTGAAGLSLCCGCATPAGAAAAREPAVALTVSAVSDGVFLVGGAGANVVVLANAEGLLLIDGGLAQHSSRLLRLLSDRWPGMPVRTLINTHWHLNHTGSNDALGRRGTRIIAHENTRLWMGTEFLVDWESRRYLPRARQALPTETFYDAGELDFGGERLRYVHVPQAHTDGDLFVHLPAANVLVTGGLVSVGRYPVLDYSTGGWLRGMLGASKSLLDVSDAGTRIVPGLGGAQTRAHLEAQHQMLGVLDERLVKLMKDGLGPEEMLAAAATREFDAEWGDPRNFVRNAYQGMWGHVHSLGVV